jgi:glutaminyl-tRNA synthetase
VEYVEAIKEDVHWLGYDWNEHLYFASDYFVQLYEYAVQLIRKGKAYVDDLGADEIREYRGTLTEAGRDSPYRNRSVEENLDLFRRMRAGEYADGAKVLRARIDMSSPNINLRDPTIYRIRHGVIHHQTQQEWVIYPMYDFTHCISDALEGITHSLCTLEFEDHRPLYDWFLDELDVGCHPQQIEFSRLSLEYTVMSKRKLHILVEEGVVEGWDDPRMPTIAGLRRRGYTPASIRSFCRRIGVSKSDNRVELALLEDCIRTDLNDSAERRMAVLHPVKVVLTNYPGDHVEHFEVANHPKNEGMGSRMVPFSREIYIDHNDFMEDPPKQFKRLVPGGEVRLRHAYVIKCNEVIKDVNGNIIELRCTIDADTLGKNPAGRKVKGVIHWVSVEHSLEAEVRLYDRLFTVPDPDAIRQVDEFKDSINPDSLRTLTQCRVEPSLERCEPGNHFQFEREGYFAMDPLRLPDNKPVFNRTVSLRDTWAKVSK